MPIIDTVNGTNKFTNKWKSQINVQGKNNGAVTTRKYALFKDKNTDGSFKPIVEPIKQDPQKIDSKNHYFSKSIEKTNTEEQTTKESNDFKTSKFEKYMKTSKNKIESSTDDGKLLTLIDRNILDYQTNSKKAGFTQSK